MDIAKSHDLLSFSDGGPLGRPESAAISGNTFEVIFDNTGYTTGYLSTPLPAVGVAMSVVTTA